MNFKHTGYSEQNDWINGQHRIYSGKETEMYSKGNEINDIRQFFWDLRYVLTKIQMKLLMWRDSQNSWTLGDEFCGYRFPKTSRSEFCSSGMAASKQKPPVICQA